MESDLEIIKNLFPECLVGIANGGDSFVIESKKK